MPKRKASKKAPRNPAEKYFTKSLSDASDPNLDLEQDFIMEACDLYGETPVDGFSMSVRSIRSRLVLSVDVPLDATWPKIRRAWPKIREWANRVKDFNEKRYGKSLPDEWPNAIAKWWTRGKEWSYADVADDLNCDLMKNLETTFYSEENWDARSMELRRIPDPIGQNALRRVRDLMTLFKIPPQEQDELIDSARERFKKHQPCVAAHEDEAPPSGLIDKGPHGRRLPVARIAGPFTSEAVRNMIHLYTRRK
jgi:hypothetical protein